MSTNVIMPQMGESIFEGTITKWLKKVGEKVNRDEPLFEISTDKVDSEIPSPAAGVVAEILVAEGKTVQINTVVAVIAAEGASTGPLESAPPQAPPAETPAPPVPAARVPESAPEQPVSQAAAAAPVAATPSKPAAPMSAGDVRTSPLVRRLAREHGVELSQIRGSGLSGRITRQDLMDFVEGRGTAREVAVPAIAQSAPSVGLAAPAETSTPAPEPFRFAGEFETVAMTPMRKAIADHMVLSKRTSAHVNTVFEVDVTPVVRLREEHKHEFEKRESVKLTFTPFIVKALVDTVREFPVLNCSVSGDNIVFKKPVNVGVAVAIESGLIVPVVKDAHLKSFTGIAVAISDLARRARSKKLRPEDVQNGTISVTNPGIYGSLFGTPVINQPQVAILGVGGVEKRPVVVGDAIAIRSMVYLSLTFDHRVIDGAVADQAMARLKERLQGWSAWVD